MEKPIYIAIAAVSIDGKIARYPGQPSDWTSPEDKDVLHALLDECNGIILGRTTYEIAIQPLSKRRCIVLTRSVPQAKKINDNYWLCPVEKGAVEKLVQQLGWKKIAVLGGTQTYTFCLEQGLLDELYLTIEPVVFGGGLPLFDGKDNPKDFRLISIKTINISGTLLLHYKTASPVNTALLK